MIRRDAFIEILFINVCYKRNQKKLKLGNITEQRCIVEAFSKAVDQASFVLKENPELIFPQIYNRLQWITKRKGILWNKLDIEGDRFKRSWIRLLNKPAEGSLLIRTFSGHSSPIKFCAFSPDGKHITSASEDETIKVWDAEIGREIKSIKYGNIYGLAPDGKLVIARKAEETIKIWDAKTGKEINTLKGHNGKLNAFEFSLDGKRIISASDDKTLKLWDAKSGEEINTFKGHTDSVNDCAFSPDGIQMASVSNDKTLKIWNIDSGEEYLTLIGHAKGVNACIYSPDGDRIVSTGHDNTLKVWDSKTGKNISTFMGHKGYLTSRASCDFSPDGKSVISGDWGHKLKLWNPDTGKELLTLVGHDGEITACAFSNDGRRIVSASEDDGLASYPTIKIWDSKTGEEILTVKGHQRIHVTKVAFSPDGRKIYSGSWDGTLRVNNAKNGKEITITKIPNYGIWAFNRDFTRVCTSNREEMVVIHDIEKDNERILPTRESFKIKECRFSPDSRRIA